MKITATLSVFAALCLFGNSHNQGATTQRGDKVPVTMPYKLVSDWPQLPAGWTLGQGSGIATDGDRVYALHRGRNPAMVLDPRGKLLHHWGDRMFCWPHGIRVDPDGNVWITDGGTGWWPTPDSIPGKGHVVLKFNAEGKLLMTLGKQGEPGEDPEHFNGPSDLAFTPNGDFYVTDGYGNSRVVKFSRNGKYILAWGKKGSAEGEFNLPHAIAIDSRGLVYVADRENLRIQIFDAAGKFINQWKHVGRPIGLALGSDGHFYVADANGQKILRVSAEGKILGEFGTKGNDPGQLGGVHHIAAGPAGALYLAELSTNRFQKFVSGQPK
jgi:DNA-binding beta-propeller fold protein YncE